MFSRLRSRILIASSTRRPVAVIVGLALGIWGFLRGRRGSLEHLRSTLSLAVDSTRIAGRPMNVTIEPTSACNLECPVCETGAGVLGRETRHMAPSQFRAIIDKIGPHTNTLMFYFMGEPFLNKHAYEMIRYAKQAGIPFVESCTNGECVNPEQLVTCGLDKVSFQIGGITQQTHEVYRVGGRLDRAMERLRETVRLRNERRAALRIEVGLILMKHNEHEAAEFRRSMLALGVDETVVIDPCVRTIEQGNRFLPSDRAHWIYDEGAFARGHLRPKVLPRNVCPWIYYSIAIHANGNVVPCCRDSRGEEVMGNILEQDLDEIWNGPKFRSLRRRIHRNQGSVGICRLCSSFPASRLH